VEKVVNQVVNIVNAIIYSSDLGRPDEIRVELARELKMNIKRRKDFYTQNNQRNKENIEIEKRLKGECGLSVVSRNDIIKYRLWEECNMISIYTGKPIKLSQLFDTAQYDIEHIIPQSRLFDDSFVNKTICESSINSDKGDMTAYDYMRGKSEQEFLDYIERINKNKKLNRRKKSYLRMPEEKIPLDFIDRQLRETQFISKAVLKILKGVAFKVTSTTGGVTDFLRYNWGLNDILHQLNIEKFRGIEKTEYVENKEKRKIERIVGWSKREDHRHHALDALVTAFTKQAYIQKLNRLNQFVKNQKALKEKARKIEAPMTNFTEVVKSKIDEILISFKKSNKVVTSNINKIKKGEIVQQTFVPRGALHKETILGKVSIPTRVKLSIKFNDVENIADKRVKEIIRKRLLEYNYDPQRAFKGLANNPIYLNEKKTKRLEEVIVLKDAFAIRKPLNTEFKQADKIIDEKIKRLVKKRLELFNNNPKEAFKDLTNNPIWQNENKKIPVKSVRIYDFGTGLQALHENKKGEPIDYVYTRNNHHISIYELPDGRLQERVVTLWEAVERKLNGLPVIDKYPTDERKFITSMEINEMFVINLDPAQIDFFDPINNQLISKHLYRVQKLTAGIYNFRHHLESKIDKSKFPFHISISSLSSGSNGWKTFNPIKVRIDNLNRIVKVGD
jgi:CRISPR-associated endonuclease Csn1